MPSSRTRVFYGWWVVAIAAQGLFFSEPTIGVCSYSVFLKAVSRDFHVGRGAVAFAFTLHNLCTASLTPLGCMIDRFGAKRIVVPATALVGLTAIFAKLIGPALSEYYVFYLVLGILGPAAGPVPYSAVISRWFDRKRLAFGSEVEVIAFLVSRYFGLRSFGVAYGFGFSSFVLAGALGTYVMGAGFDRTHSYTAPLILMLFAMVLATILFARIGPYRFAASSVALRVQATASEVAP